MVINWPFPKNGRRCKPRFDIFRHTSRARPDGLALSLVGVVGLAFLWVGLWLAEEGEDDLDLFWGEDFAGAGVAGGLEGGEEGLVGVDFADEEFSRALLAAVGEIGHSKVLLAPRRGTELR